MKPQKLTPFQRELARWVREHQAETSRELDRLVGQPTLFKEPPMDTAKCRSCGAAIMWVKTQSGKSMPLDAAPVDATKVDGTCFVEDGVAYFGAIDRPPGDLHYVSHFATCPNAKQHRKL